MDDIGLVFSCPMDYETETCPFIFLRKEESIDKRLNVWKNMKVTDRIELVVQHRKCLDSREYKK